MLKRLSLLLFIFFLCGQLSAQVHRLPDVFKLHSGKKVETRNDWYAAKRPEIVETFTNQVYGKLPVTSQFNFRYYTLEPPTAQLAGKAYRVQIRMVIENAKGDSLPVNVMMYYPANAVKQPVPFFAWLNYGNHTLLNDSMVKYSPSAFTGVERKQRNIYSRRFPLQDIIDAGCGVITANYEDFCPDNNTTFRSEAAPFYSLHPDSTGAISLWAWAHSRLLDLALQQKIFDSRKAAVMGHSRLGKAALWTAVNDERFQFIFANESGTGGARMLHHYSPAAESVAAIVQTFPFWFCKNFHQYAGRDTSLPFDHHWLLAAVAPRHVYVADAEEDLWCDPLGEFLSLKEAEKVYRFLGKPTILPQKFPIAGANITKGFCGYHLRKGKHDLAREDWVNFCRFLTTEL